MESKYSSKKRFFNIFSGIYCWVCMHEDVDADPSYYICIINSTWITLIDEIRGILYFKDKSRFLCVYSIYQILLIYFVW